MPCPSPYLCNPTCCNVTPASTSEFYVQLHELVKAHEAEIAALRGQSPACHKMSDTIRELDSQCVACAPSVEIVSIPMPPCDQQGHDEMKLEQDQVISFRIPSLTSSDLLQNQTGEYPDRRTLRSISCGSSQEWSTEGPVELVESHGGFELHASWQHQHGLALTHSRRSSSVSVSSNGSETASAWGGRRNPAVLHPNSLGRLLWDVGSMLLLAYDIVVIPFTMAFDPDPSAVSIVMNYATMIFWTIDIILTFFTGYQTERFTEMRLTYIAWRYVKTWLFLDIPVVALDWYLIVLASGQSGNTARLGRSLRSLRIMRTLRLLRVLKLKRLIQVVQDQITTEFVSICWGITKVVLCLVVANHIVACSWYAIGSGSFGQRSWLDANDVEGRSLAYLYATSAHWSLTQFTPASMEVFPQNTVERVFAVCVLLMALITFSSFVSMLTTSMAQLRQLSNNESRQFWLLRRYLREWCVPRHTSRRIEHYLEYAYQRQQQRVQPKEIPLLNLLSDPLKEELKHEVLKSHVALHPLFKAGMAVTRVFSKGVSERSLASGDVVFSCSEQAKAMMFVSSGILMYTLGYVERPEGSTPMRTTSDDLASAPPARTMSDDLASVRVHRGQYVSEPVLWCPWLHVGDMVSLNECNVVYVDSDSFGRAICDNRPVWKAVKGYARRYVHEMNKIPRENLTDLLQDYICSESLVDDAGFTNPVHGIDDKDEQDASWVTVVKHILEWMKNFCGHEPPAMYETEEDIEEETPGEQRRGSSRNSRCVTRT